MRKTNRKVLVEYTDKKEINPLHENLKALRAICDNCTPNMLEQVSHVSKLLENTLFNNQIEFIYNKYKNKLIDKTLDSVLVDSIITLTYKLLPECHWVTFNNDNMLEKIHPCACIFKFPNYINTEGSTFKSLIFELDELICYYNYQGFNFKTKCDVYYDNKNYIGYYIYNDIGIFNCRVK